MTSTLQSLSTDQLRALFLAESKRFVKTLDYSDDMNGEARGQVLEEIRQKLKDIIELINERERREVRKLN